MTERTITVEDCWGKPRILTESEFVKRWTDETCSLYALCDDLEDLGELQVFEEWVAKRASARFTLLAQKLPKKGALS